MKRYKAEGDGYNGVYLMMPTIMDGVRCFVLRGQGGDYLTPGIGVPIYEETPEKLLEKIAIRRPGVRVKEVL